MQQLATQETHAFAPVCGIVCMALNPTYSNKARAGKPADQRDKNEK
jgi:hypothetical protein